MEREKFVKHFNQSLSRYNFKRYGSKLFYLDLPDVFIILKHMIYNGGGEIYLELIIKECHPEVNKITKNILQNKLLIDTHSSNKLLYRTLTGYHWNFFEIEEISFDDIIDDFYNENIKPFEMGYLIGIECFNELYNKIFYGHQLDLYKDSAIKIGHLELASYRDHQWFLSDVYRLEYEYQIDSRFINSHTASYIMEHVINKVPDYLKGKEQIRWCNQQCKEIFVSKKMRRDFGRLAFPLVDGKPLKLLRIDTDKENGQSIQIYINEETNEIYHCKIISSILEDITYELYKME